MTTEPEARKFMLEELAKLEALQTQLPPPGPTDPITLDERAEIVEMIARMKALAAKMANHGT